jgi:hypothetical protein
MGRPIKLLAALAASAALVGIALPAQAAPTRAPVGGAGQVVLGRVAPVLNIGIGADGLVHSASTVPVTVTRERIGSAMVTTVVAR